MLNRTNRETDDLGWLPNPGAFADYPLLRPRLLGPGGTPVQDGAVARKGRANWSAKLTPDTPAPAGTQGNAAAGSGLLGSTHTVYSRPTGLLFLCCRRRRRRRRRRRGRPRLLLRRACCVAESRAIRRTCDGCNRALHADGNRRKSFRRMGGPWLLLTPSGDGKPLGWRLHARLWSGRW